MISKLPKWVELGALILALIAGFVNAIGLLSFEHQAVSHVTGTSTILGTGLLSLPFKDIAHLLGILASFISGSIIAGYLLQGSTLKLGKHYDTALFLESSLLMLTFYFLSKGSFYGHFFASAACGLQNALATTYSGAVIRTTHLTGIFTDLGIMFGELIRGVGLDKRKLILYLTIITAFVFGGTLGALLFTKYNFLALLFPAGVCFAIAIAYRIFSNRFSS